MVAIAAADARLSRFVASVVASRLLALARRASAHKAKPANDIATNAPAVAAPAMAACW
jgi:hypothetical protein